MMVFKYGFLLLALFSLLDSTCGQEWESVSPFPVTLTHHAIGFSFNETGYIVTGGSTVISSSSFFEYNSITNTWTQKEDFPGDPRSYAIGDFYDGKQYIGLGVNFADGIYLRDLWSYDPSSDTWEELAECPCSGRQHPSFNALDGKIYVGLGTDISGDVEDFWAYDIESNTWSQKANFIGGKRHHPYHFTLGEYVYVGFGHNHMEHDVKNDWYRYDPQNDAWTQLNDLPAEGRVAGTQFHHNGYGYALSGQGEDLTSGFHHPMEEGEFWRYDAQSDSWDQLTPHPGPSRYAPASFVIDDYAYIISGLFDASEQSETMRIKLEGVNSISDIPSADIRIFPNPSSSSIHISVNEKRSSFFKSVTIYSSDGRSIFSQQNLENSSIDISSIKNGIYYLIIIVDGVQYEKVFIKSDS